ncbi:hypothetical protein GX586_09285 [bacterium]|nr:hypothetical protein [bacterium]
MKHLLAVLTVIAVLSAALPGRAALLSYDDFNCPSQTNYLSSLALATNGFGWKAAWDVQPAAWTSPGFRITNLPLLAYIDGAGKILLTNGMLAVGGDIYRTAGRRVGVNETTEEDNQYNPYRKVRNGIAYVGAEGTELWFSALVRPRITANTYVMYLHSGATARTFSGARIGIGLNGGIWELRCTDSNLVTQTDSTGVARVANTTYLMVLRMAFAQEGDVIDLFVNPASIGSDEPTTPSASITVTDDVYFRSFYLYPGDSSNDGYADEVRIGETYADVTPAIPEPAFALALASLALAFRRK